MKPIIQPLPPLFLASTSPRRSELLKQLKLEFSVINAPIEEVALPKESAESYVLRMAIEKALSGFNKVAGKQIWVVGGDTAILLNGRVLGKPKNEAGAYKMLSSLSGNTHQVLSGVAVVYDGEVFSTLTSTYVEFDRLTERTILEYIATQEPFGKAGAYAIQGIAAQFIKKIEGSYSAVMGLPLFELNQLLFDAGYSK
ncbi:MAG: septum formation inhibitor Maf [Gammaproteobacteria bacterium]|nr:septum formation inhibitor Maf [Gammaproteobacteria bacterium]